METIIFTNKKVLLYERKRHTACRVESAHYAVPVGVPPPYPGTHPKSGWGIPPSPCQGTPTLTWEGGNLLHWSGRGYPNPDLEGATPVRKDGVPPMRKDGGTLPSGRMGVPPHQWMGVPPPWTDTQTEMCENITFPHPSDAGGKYSKSDDLTIITFATSNATSNANANSTAEDPQINKPLMHTLAIVNRRTFLHQGDYKSLNLFDKEMKL